MAVSLAVCLAALTGAAVADKGGFLAAPSNVAGANTSLPFGDALNSTQGSRLTPNEEVDMTCTDAPNWANGYYDCQKESSDPRLCTAGGWTCAAYVEKGWCRQNRCLGPADTGGVYACGAGLKYPEHNCCACGGGGGCKPLGSRCNTDDECCPDGAGGPPTCADEGYGKECLSP